MPNEVSVVFCFAANEVRLKGSHGKCLSWAAEEGHVKRAFARHQERIQSHLGQFSQYS